jgi:hypothetical protein
LIGWQRDRGRTFDGDFKPSPLFGSVTCSRQVAAHARCIVQQIEFTNFINPSIAKFSTENVLLYHLRRLIPVQSEETRPVSLSFCPLRTDMNFLSTLQHGLGIAFVLVSFFSPCLSAEPGQTTGDHDAKQEFYELRIYKIYDFDKQRIAEEYLKNALLPALNRIGLERIGVFTNMEDENDHSIVMVIPYPSIDVFTSLNQRLAADREYQAAAQSYFDRQLKDPVFQRIESRLMKAFAGMPVMEVPDYSKLKQDRIFELRLYESHTEDHARRKVKMFNDGEIQIMRDTDLGPVFFGETLIGPDIPNLIYMLSSTDSKTHKTNWKKFLDHPEWNRIKVLEEYKGTVSRIQKWILQPTSYSQL